MKIRNILIWFARTGCVVLPVVIYKDICPEQWYWQILNWLLIWIGISVYSNFSYIKLGGD